MVQNNELSKMNINNLGYSNEHMTKSLNFEKRNSVLKELKLRDDNFSNKPNDTSFNRAQSQNSNACFSTINNSKNNNDKENKKVSKLPTPMS